MKLQTLFEEKKVVFSLEIFPPKKSSSIQTIYDTLDALRDIEPDFISVTYGAGGSRFRADTAADDPGRGAAPDNAPAADQRRGTSAGAAVLLLLGRAGAGDGR